mgnify:CR=1 FL=1|jgi:hypothetical protein
MEFKYCNEKTIKVIKLLLDKIEKSEINDSIDFSYYLGEILFYNQIPLFDISDVEERIIEKAHYYIDSYDFNIENNGFLFVVTEPHITGGHTRLMENLSLMIDDKDLIVTKSMNTEVKSRLNNFFPQIIECYRHNKENSINHISKLVYYFLKYNSIILNIHPQDIYTVIACGIAKKIKKELIIYFVNHADHAFTFGTTISDFWFGISIYGDKIDNLRNLKAKRTFLGIPINKINSDFFKTISYKSIINANNFITAGSSIKYKPLKNDSIFPLISKLLQFKRNSLVSVIGVNIIKNYWWLFLKLKYLKKLKLYKALSYKKYIDTTSKADCYIDSHPFPGGTAFVEQFLNGTPCIGLKSNFFGYSPLEIIKKDSVEEIIEQLKNPPSDEEIKSIQELIFEVHAFSRVKYRLKNTLEIGMIFNNPMIKNIHNQDLRFFTHKNINITVDFFKFLLKKNKLVCIKILFIVNPLILIKFLVLKLIKS